MKDHPYRTLYLRNYGSTWLLGSWGASFSLCPPRHHLSYTCTSQLSRNVAKSTSFLPRIGKRARSIASDLLAK